MSGYQVGTSRLAVYSNVSAMCLHSSSVVNTSYGLQCLCLLDWWLVIASRVLRHVQHMLWWRICHPHTVTGVCLAGLLACWCRATFMVSLLGTLIQQQLLCTRLMDMRHTTPSSCCVGQ